MNLFSGSEQIKGKELILGPKQVKWAVKITGQHVKLIVLGELFS